MPNDPFSLIKEQYQQASQWMLQRFAALFSQIADPVIVLRPEDIIYHQITTYSYYPADKRPAKIGEYQLEHFFTDEEKTTVYVNHLGKKLIIAYRGTDFKNVRDLMSDVQIVLGVSGLDKRVEEALQMYDLVNAKYPEYSKNICGHSLGGTICYIVAKHRHPDRCVVFNPGSAPNTLFIQMLAETVQKARWSRNVYTYKTLADVVSAFSFVGTTKVFRVPAIDPVVLHDLNNFKQPGVEYVKLETV